MKGWRLYVAAACPKTGAHAWSWRLVKPGAGFEDGVGGEAWASPYRLHLLALLDALPHIPDGTEVTVITTDSLLCDVFDRYLANWEANGFRRKGLKSVDLLPQLPAHTHRLTIVTEHLKRRAGDPHAKDCKLHAVQTSKTVTPPERQTGPATVRNDVEVVAWTDGGSSPNPGPSGWGALIVHLASQTTLTLRGGADEATNNRMELTAIAEALAVFTRRTRVEVRTDSKFAISVCTEWRRGWKRRGWQRANGEPPVNLDVIQRLDQLCDLHDVVFTWVPGHTGEPGNERADELCNEAIDAVRSGADPSLKRRDADLPFPIEVG